MVESVVQSHAEIVVGSDEKKLIRVLHVDDELGLLKVAKQCLELQGPFHVDTAGSAEEALNKLKEKEYDAIVSDYQMPGKNGLQFLEELRHSGNGVPFIIFTGKGREEVIIRALNLGAEHYVNKNGDPETVYAELKQAISETVRIRKTESELQESQMRYRNLIENAPDVIYTISENGTLASLNSAFERLTGWKCSEWICKSFASLVHPDDLNTAMETFEKTLHGECLPPYELRVLSKSGEYLVGEFTSRPWSEKGKIVGEFGVVRDITGRKKAEGALRASEEKHRIISGISTDVVFSCLKMGEEGFIVDWLEGATEKIFGHSAKEIMDEGCWKFAVQPQDLPTFEEKVTGLKPGQSSVCELRITHKDGSTRWLRVFSHVVEDTGNPENHRLLGACEDVTERKQVEQELRRFSVAVKTSLDGVISGDLNGNITDVNEAALRMYGGTDKSDLIGKNVIDLLVERDRTRALHDSMESMKTGQGKTVEYCALTKSGIEVPIEITTAFMKEEQGEPTGFVDIIRNITERKKAELELEESEARYRSLVEQSLAGIIIAQGPAVHAVFVNRAMTDIWGYTAEEIYSLSQQQIEKMIHPEDRSLFFKSFEDRLKGKNVPSHYEFRALRKDGNVIWLEISAGLIEYNGRLAVQGIFTDITERKKAEEAVRESEEKLRAIFEAAVDGIAYIDTSGKVVAVNKRLMEMMGYGVNETVGRNIAELGDIDSEDLQRVLKAMEEVVATGKSVKDFEVTLIRKDGSRVRTEISTGIVRREGKVVGITTTIRDITERKKVEQALKESEEKYRGLVELAPDGIVAVNVEGIITSANRSFLALVGYDSAEEIVGKPFTELMTMRMDDIPKFQGMFKSLMKGESPSPSEFLYVRRDGTSLWAEVHPGLMIKDGYPVGVQAIMRDVSERKNTEKLTQESHQKFEGLFRHNPEAAVYLGQNFKIVDVNPRFCQLFGYPAEEVKGKDINDLIVPEGMREEAESLDKDAKNGYASHNTVRKRKDGSLVHVSISAAPVAFENDLLGHVGIYKDITRLKNAEEHLGELNKMLEATNEKLHVVGGLTRHDVRNKLSAVTGNAYLLKRKLVEDPEALEQLADMENAVRNVETIFEFARKYEQLGVEQLVNLSVGKAVDEAASLFPCLKGIRIVNECHGLTVLADSLLCALFYNLIDNSLKYGKKLSQIRIHYEKAEEKQLRLVYEDDGVGIALDAKSKIFNEGYTTGKGSGYGLYLVRRMMDVYGWTIQETGTPDNGVCFTIMMPEKNQDGKENYQLH
jgi:PAS domain S-box-containing protein